MSGFNGRCLWVFERGYNPIFKERAGYDFLAMIVPWTTDALSILKPVDIAMPLFLFLPEAIKRGMLPREERIPTVAITAPVGFASVPKYQGSFSTAVV